VVSLQLQDDSFNFVYSEDGSVIAQVAATPGFGSTPDLGAVPVSLTLLGPAGAQMSINGNGIGMRSPGENPGIVGQTFSKAEGLAISFDEGSRIKEAYAAEIGIGNVVTPANRGVLKVTAYLDDAFVAEQTIAIRNGFDQVVLFDPDGDQAFDRIELRAADGNAIQFSVTGVEFALTPDYLLS
jgi:hypothetical protein